MNRDKSLLYPPFAEQLRDFELRLVAAKLSFYLFMGLRTFEDQDELYAQGRTSPGPPCKHKGDIAPRPIGFCSVHPLGLTVTNARGGDSWHCYALAGDYVLDGQISKPGIQWSWDTRADINADGRNDWLQMGELAEQYGLEWGGRWKRFPDFPHVQNRYGLTLTEAKELYRIGGIKHLWQELDAEMASV